MFPERKLRKRVQTDSSGIVISPGERHLWEAIGDEDGEFELREDVLRVGEGGGGGRKERLCERGEDGSGR